jgi:hypothetical protein
MQRRWGRAQWLQNNIVELGQAVVCSFSSSKGFREGFRSCWWVGGVIRLTINGHGSLIPTMLEDSHRRDSRSHAFAIRLMHPLTTHMRRWPMGSTAWRGSIC